MFEKLMSKFTEERNKMVDYCTESLFNHAGVNIPDNPTGFNLLLMMDELKKKDYKIKIVDKEDCIRISLIKLEELYEDEMVWYDIKVDYNVTSSPRVSLVAIAGSK